jgi:predicted nucleotidyltransferase
VVASQVELVTKIDDFVRRLTSAIRVEAVILYGSYANGRADEWSDIDLAIISPDFEGLSTWDRQEVIARASVGRPYRLAPIGYPSSEYHNPGRHSFLREIIRTGKVVYQASH